MSVCGLSNFYLICYIMFTFLFIAVLTLFGYFHSSFSTCLILFILCCILYVNKWWWWWWWWWWWPVSELWWPRLDLVVTWRWHCGDPAIQRWVEPAATRSWRDASEKKALSRHAREKRRFVLTCARTRGLCLDMREKKEALSRQARER